MATSIEPSAVYRYGISFRNTGLGQIRPDTQYDMVPNVIFLLAQQFEEINMKALKCITLSATYMAQVCIYTCGKNCSSIYEHDGAFTGL